MRIAAKQSHHDVREILSRTGFFEFVSEHPLNREEFISALRMAPTIKKDYYTILSEPESFKRAVEYVETDEILRRVIR